MIDRRRSQKFEKLHTFAEIKSRKGLQAVQYLQQKLAQERGKMSELEQCKIEYLCEGGAIDLERSSSQSGFLLKNENRFLAKLDQAMEQQRQQITAVAGQLDKVNTHWQTLDRKTQSFQRLSESAVAEEMASESVREQKEADSFATQSRIARLGSRSGGQN